MGSGSSADWTRIGAIVGIIALVVMTVFGVINLREDGSNNSVASTADPTPMSHPAPTTTSSTSTTQPSFDPEAWILENLVEIRSDGMPSTGTFQLARGFGILVSDGGFVLTTASAVLGASRVDVFLPDERLPVEAEVVSVSECRDLALIDIGRARPGAVSLDVNPGPAAWLVSVDDGKPVVDNPGVSSASPRLSIDAEGDVVSINGVAGPVLASEAAEIVERMRRRDLVPELGFLAAAVSGGLEVLAVSEAASQLRVGDYVVEMSDGVAPSLSVLCDLFSVEPVNLLLQRDGREWEGELGGADFRLTSARTPDEIKNATVRVDVDSDGDGLFGGDLDRSGSGFFITETGFLATSHHVVAGIPSVGAVEVVFDNFGARLSASIVGRSSCSDVALLHVEGNDFAYLGFSPDPPRLDDAVRSVGYPNGTDLLTIKRGNISKEKAARTISSPSLPIFEHSAETIPGSSGGPVVNEIGEVVGIHYAGRTTAGINEELAISGPDARSVLEQLEDGDTAHIGLIWSHDSDAAFVDSVDPNSIADAAGLRIGDRLVAIGDQDLYESLLVVDELCESVLNGDAVPLLVERTDGDVTFRLEGDLNGSTLERVLEPTYVTDPTEIVGTLAPAGWTDYDPFGSTEGSDFRGFRASPDVGRFLNDGFGSQPGMRIAVSWLAGMTESPIDRLQRKEFPQCTDGGESIVDEGEYQGFVRRWFDCQGTDSVLLDFALTDTNQSPLMVVVTIVASSGEIDEISQLVLSDLNVNRLPPPDIEEEGD